MSPLTSYGTNKIPITICTGWLSHKRERGSEGGPTGPCSEPAAKCRKTLGLALPGVPWVMSKKLQITCGICQILKSFPYSQFYFFFSLRDLYSLPFQFSDTQIEFGYSKTLKHRWILKAHTQLLELIFLISFFKRWVSFWPTLRNHYIFPISTTEHSSTPLKAGQCAFLWFLVLFVHSTLRL